MIQIVLDTYDSNKVGVDDGLYSHPKNEGFAVLSYDYKLDHNLLIDLERFLLKRKPQCEACIHCKKEGAFCGYCASYCDCTNNHIELSNNYAIDCDKYKFNEKYLTEFYN